MRLSIGFLLCACLFAQSGVADRKQDGATNKNKSRSDSQGSGPTSPAGVSQPFRQPERESDRKIADYTESLAHYTLALVIVGVLQFVALLVQGAFLYRAFRETQAATMLTRESNAEVLRANAANEALTSQSNAITRDATNLTYQSIALTHRPKLIAFGFYLHGGGLRPGSTADGEFSIVNTGGTRARVESIWVTGGFRLPMKRPYEGQAGDPVDKVLRPGEAMNWKFNKADGALAPEDLTAFNVGQRLFYVLGFIKYADDLNPPTLRHTFFGRLLNRDSMRFEAVKDDDYERAD